MPRYALPNGIHLAACWHGRDDGPVVIFLHGLGSQGDDWLLQVEALRNDYRLLTVDLRGHGTSDKPRHGYSIAALTEDVAQLMDVLGIASAHVVGLSLGAVTALNLAITRPARVQCLVLINGFARLQRSPDQDTARLLRRFWQVCFGDMGQVAATVAEGLFPDDSQAAFRAMTEARLRTNPQYAYRQLMLMHIGLDLRPRLGDVTQPALVIAGEHDTTVPLACKQALASGIPNSTLVVIPNSGHASPLDQHELVNQHLAAFLAGEQIQERTHGSPRY